MRNIRRWLIRHNPWHREPSLDERIAEVETLLRQAYSRLLLSYPHTAQALDVTRRLEHLLATLYYMRDARQKAGKA